MTVYNLHGRYFDPATSHISAYFCQLFILIGEDYFQYCILDTDKNKFIALVDFRLPSSERSTDKICFLIEEIISSEELLHKNYPSVIVGVNNPYHTLVPSPLFDKGQIQKYLEFNFKIPENHHYKYDRLEEMDAINASCIQENLEEVITRHFSKAAIVHGSTAVIKAAYLNNKINPGQSLFFLNVRGHNLDLAMFEGNRPVLFNSFPFNGKEDLLYFTLLMIEQSGHRPDKVQLCLSGMIEENSETFQLLMQYISHLTFASRLSSFDYSALLGQLPSHYYQDLYALALCGS